MNRLSFPVRCVSLLAFAGLAAAQPAGPAYQCTFSDCVTGDNDFIFKGLRYWTVDPGCDIYQIDTYERPTVQRYDFMGGAYASNEYFEYLDITGASVGADARWLYVRIDLFGRDRSTDNGDNIPVGLVERYDVRFATDPDGRFGFLIRSEDPENKNFPNTAYGPIGVHGFRDTNGDVGGAASSGPTGLSVTKSDNPDEESGLNGYDEAFIQDGSLDSGPPIAFVRLDPADNTAVEIVVDYLALGFTRETIRQIRFLDVEAIKGGPTDPSSRHWNDKFSREEAGSPNPGSGGASEFGTEGL